MAGELSLGTQLMLKMIRRINIICQGVGTFTKLTTHRGGEDTQSTNTFNSGQSWDPLQYHIDSPGYSQRRLSKIKQRLVSLQNNEIHFSTRTAKRPAGLSFTFCICVRLVRKLCVYMRICLWLYTEQRSNQTSKLQQTCEFFL